MINNRVHILIIRKDNSIKVQENIYIYGLPELTAFLGDIMLAGRMDCIATALGLDLVTSTCVENRAETGR